MLEPRAVVAAKVADLFTYLFLALFLGVLIPALVVWSWGGFRVVGQ